MNYIATRIRVEAMEVTHMARHLSAFGLLYRAMNDNYQDTNPSLWPGLG
ncbi:MAG: hypothetical protein HZA49_04085 [Planctomycetes bacterium]|nr:hypothetical protein [Planctomycetota bacterium]